MGEEERCKFLGGFEWPFEKGIGAGIDRFDVENLESVEKKK
jgi:hypothetical protein